MDNNAMDYTIRVRSGGASIARAHPSAMGPHSYLGFVNGVDGYRWLDHPYWWPSAEAAGTALANYLALRVGSTNEP